MRSKRSSPRYVRDVKRSAVPVVWAVVAAMASVGHADDAAEPRMAATVLTLQKGAGKAGRLLVQRADVTHMRSLKTCPVHITLATQHAQFRTIELDFAYKPPTTAKKVPLQVVAMTARQGDAAARGQAMLSFKSQDGGFKRLVAKVDARIDHAGASWQLRGTVEVANTACVFGAM
jgi:hypothetical protein